MRKRLKHYAANGGNGNGVRKDGRGRPSPYQPSYAHDAESMCRLGATDADLAEHFGVNTTTIWHWGNRHQAFFEALKKGKDAFDDRVERSLAQRAIGYTFDTVEYYIVDKELVPVPTRKHFPPDTVACIFWLKNRRPEQWRDKQHHEHSGGMTTTEIKVDYKEVLERRIRAIISRLSPHEKEKAEAKLIESSAN